MESRKYCVCDKTTGQVLYIRRGKSPRAVENRLSNTIQELSTIRLCTAKDEATVKARGLYVVAVGTSPSGIKNTQVELLRVDKKH